MRRNLTEKRSKIARHMKQIVGYLRLGSFNSRRIANIVNFIRLNAEYFVKWHKTETLKLFVLPEFKKKDNLRLLLLNYCVTPK